MHIGGVDIRSRNESFRDVTESRQNVHHDTNMLATSRKLRRGVLTNQILLTAAATSSPIIHTV